METMKETAGIRGEKTDGKNMSLKAKNPLTGRAPVSGMQIRETSMAAFMKQESPLADMNDHVGAQDAPEAIPKKTNL